MKISANDGQRQRRWWSRQAWLPWTPFADSAADYRRRAAAAGPLTPAHGRQAALLTLATVLVVATAVFPLALPRLSLLVEVIGGLLVSVVVLIWMGRISDVPVALRELRVTIEEGAERSSFASQMYLLRLGLLDLLLHVQARRAEARRAEVLPEETPDANDGRITGARSSLGRDLGVYVLRGGDRQHEEGDPHDQPGRKRGVGARQYNRSRTGWPLQRRRPHHDVAAPLQAAAPALALAAPAPSDRRTDTAPSLAPRFLPTAGGGVDQRRPPRFARGGESVPVPGTPPPLSPPSRPARGALPVSPSPASLPAPYPTPGDGGTEQ